MLLLYRNKESLMILELERRSQVKIHSIDHMPIAETLIQMKSRDVWGIRYFPWVELVQPIPEIFLV